jgi:hypothetical protein
MEVSSFQETACDALRYCGDLQFTPAPLRQLSLLRADRSAHLSPPDSAQAAPADPLPQKIRSGYVESRDFYLPPLPQRHSCQLRRNDAGELFFDAECAAAGPDSAPPFCLGEPTARILIKNPASSLACPRSVRAARTAAEAQQATPPGRRFVLRWTGAVLLGNTVLCVPLLPLPGSEGARRVPGPGAPQSVTPERVVRRLLRLPENLPDASLVACLHPVARLPFIHRVYAERTGADLGAVGHDNRQRSRRRFALGRCLIAQGVMRQMGLRTARGELRPAGSNTRLLALLLTTRSLQLMPQRILSHSGERCTMLCRS